MAWIGLLTGGVWGGRRGASRMNDDSFGASGGPAASVSARLSPVELDAPFRDHGPIDVRSMLSLVSRLAPLFERPDTPLWAEIAERMKWVGRDDRPADVGFRKMVPTSYVQLCIRNDEHPRSPWALDIPASCISLEEQAAFARAQEELCASLYGPGVLYFLVFAVLGPGGKIPPHRDMPHDVNKKAHSHHLHVPLTAADDAEFTLHDQAVVFRTGHVYEIDNMKLHSVLHRGSGYRVNLMLDFCPNANLEKRNAPSPPREGKT